MDQRPVIVKGRRDISTRARSARIWLVLAFTLVVWLSKAHDYLLDGESARAAFAGVNTIVAVYSAAYKDSVAVLVFCVLIVSHLRIFFGIEFAERDRSFNNALEKFAPRDQKRFQTFAEVVLGMLAAITIALSYCVGVKASWVMPLLLLVEALAIITFDIVFWKVLLDLDTERKYNKFIVLNDFVFLFICVEFFIAPVLQTFQVKLPELLFLFMPPIYVALLTIEIATEYKKSLRDSWRNTKFVLKVAFATLRNWRSMYARAGKRGSEMAVSRRANSGQA